MSVCIIKKLHWLHYTQVPRSMHYRVPVTYCRMRCQPAMEVYITGWMNTSFLAMCFLLEMLTEWSSPVFVCCFCSNLCDVAASYTSFQYATVPPPFFVTFCYYYTIILLGIINVLSALILLFWLIIMFVTSSYKVVL